MKYKEPEYIEENIDVDLHDSITVNDFVQLAKQYNVPLDNIVLRIESGYDGHNIIMTHKRPPTKKEKDQHYKKWLRNKEVKERIEKVQEQESYKLYQTLHKKFGKSKE
jgi:hypothetical protein